MRGSGWRWTSSAARCPRRHALSTVHGDHGVLVAVLSERGSIADLARRAQDALDAAFAGDGHAMIGYSDACEHLRDAYRAHEHAHLALRVSVALPEHGSPAGWEDLGAYRLLARAAATPRAQELIHPGLPKLFALHSKESLVQTLEAYLDNGCDTKLTAESLFLHRASPVLPAAAHRGDHRHQPQERRGPTCAAFRAQARPLGGHSSGAQTNQRRLESLATLV